ncbi:MAG: type II toxin-antitoxin system VapC family toxin [Desulfurispora sp.]|uniref:type II toxin-antitoxin system VapC family toxin n=1 Tax=Desulfurispora sp. TaxID=3014275 RepID=UPI00404961BF
MLDTNIVIALFAGDENVLQNIVGCRQIFLPSIVLGELYYGAQKSQRVEANSRRIDELVFRVKVLSVDTQTARLYGQIKSIMQRKGQPIPENDLWIAALAQQHGLVLATRDQHFNFIPNVVVVNW